MDPRVVARNLLASAEMENGLVNVKRATATETPSTVSKRPFSETTNKAADLLKSAKKIVTVEIETIENDSKGKQGTIDWHDIDNWERANYDDLIYGCNDRKMFSDQWSTNEFYDKLPLVGEATLTPPASPFKEPMISPVIFMDESQDFDLDFSFTTAAHAASVQDELLDSSLLEVPESDESVIDGW